MAQWIAPSLASVQGWTVDKPRSRFANSEGRMPGERRFGVAFLLVTFSLAKQREVTRSPEASEKRQGCRVPQERALSERSHWTPASAGATSNRRRVKSVDGSRATNVRCDSEQSHWAPACAGATSSGRRVKRGHKSRATNLRYEAQQSHWALACEVATGVIYTRKKQMSGGLR